MNKLLQRGIMLAAVALVLGGFTARGDDATPPKGQRVLSAGHSFHVFVPGILRELATGAGIKDHTQVDVSSIGGSRIIQHWDLAEDKNKAKKALATGKVDVFTMSPIYLPDEGIENFVKLALEQNPDIRITIQEFWLPYDVYSPKYQQKRPDKVDRNTRTVEEMQKEHAPYFKEMDDHVAALNKKYGKPTLAVVPVGQAVIGLRAKIIAGEAPGLKMQEDLFTDPIGHVRAPVQVLNAYCHYAVIYRKSPVGLEMPSSLKNAKLADGDKLNRLLQELAWDAAVNHPLSGVKR